MEILEKQDIQGIIARGYKDLEAATFLLLQINDVAKAKKYLKRISTKIVPANNRRPQKALHVAFTWAGINKLNVTTLDFTFSREFREGMTQELRSALLGDQHANAPDNWKWGGPKSKVVHILLLCYAENQHVLDRLVRRQKKMLYTSEISIIESLETHINKNSKEHFGFRDGISQPPMEGLSGSADKDPSDTIKAGEFVLGYKNEYDQFTASPLVHKSNDPENLLPQSREEDFKDLGKNGTYLVFRQMTQDVFKFWKYLKENSKEPASDQKQAAIHLGAKMVGRWPGGAPLAISEFDDPKKNDCNTFSYLRDDPDGINCPFGAHIRRTNPRDQLFSGRSEKASRQMIRKHQIIRRGRIFGNPFVDSMNPEEILDVKEGDEVERGIHFICLTGHINRQFEFIQNVWANNPVFADLCNETDPIISPGNKFDFTCQAIPIRRKYKEIPQFTRVIGGAYFFLPGINALKFIAGSASGKAKGKIPGPDKKELHQKEKEIAKEYPEPGEDFFAGDIINVLKKSLQTTYGRGKFHRRFHPKSLGLLEAEIIIRTDLAENLKVGLFKTPGTYKAWVRFSNASPRMGADNKKSVRGMAIKILNVDKDPLEHDESGKTQDIILTNNKILFPGTVKMQSVGIRQLFNKSIIAAVQILFYTISSRKIKSAFKFLKGLIVIPNMLECSYFSATPYLYGEGKAVKWRARPLKPANSDMPVNPEKDFLRQQLSADLSAGEFDFDLCIQLQEDPEKEPVEDSAVEWKTDFIKVATITILQQDFNTQERKQLEDTIVFSPWHSMPEHRPLGGINRIRRKIYSQLAEERMKHNKSAGY